MTTVQPFKYEEILAQLIDLRRSNGESQTQLAEGLTSDGFKVRQAGVGHWESRRNNVSLRIAEAWAQRYKHRLMAIPNENGAAALHRLFRSARGLSVENIGILISVAKALPRLSGTMQHLIREIAEEAIAKDI